MLNQEARGNFANITYKLSLGAGGEEGRERERGETHLASAPQGEKSFVASASSQSRGRYLTKTSYTPLPSSTREAAAVAAAADK